MCISVKIKRDGTLQVLGASPAVAYECSNLLFGPEQITSRNSTGTQLCKEQTDLFAPKQIAETVELGQRLSGIMFYSVI